MAVRRLNYTGRKRIRQTDVRFVIHEDGSGSATFDGDLSGLGNCDLPADARVYVETYRQTSWMRFDFGTIEAISPPEDRRLCSLQRSFVQHSHSIIWR